jgi:hypothetical protein
MSTPTAGQKLAATLRQMFSVGTRTRRWRKGNDIHAEFMEAIRNATVYPGYYTGDKHTALAGAWSVYNTWSKHVDGYRIDPVLRSKIAKLSPWQLANLLGRMVDAGITNTGEGEMFFAALQLP